MSVLIMISSYFGGGRNMMIHILKCNDFLFSFLYDSRNVVTGLGMIIMTVLSISEHRTSTAHELSLRH